MPYADPEVYRKHQEAYRRDLTSGKRKEYADRFKAKYPDKGAQYQEAYRTRHKGRTVARHLKESAVKRKLPYGLTGEIVERMLAETTVCPALGIPLAKGNKHRRDNSPSFDCFIPSLGYVPGNVYVISWRANRLKNNATTAEIQALAAWMTMISTIEEEQNNGH